MPRHDEDENAHAHRHTFNSFALFFRWRESNLGVGTVLTIRDSCWWLTSPYPVTPSCKIPLALLSVAGKQLSDTSFVHPSMGTATVWPQHCSDIPTVKMITQWKWISVAYIWSAGFTRVSANKRPLDNGDWPLIVQVCGPSSSLYMASKTGTHSDIVYALDFIPSKTIIFFLEMGVFFFSGWGGTCA